MRSIATLCSLRSREACSSIACSQRLCCRSRRGTLATPPCFLVEAEPSFQVIRNTARNRFWSQSQARLGAVQCSNCISLAGACIWNFITRNIEPQSLRRPSRKSKNARRAINRRRLAVQASWHTEPHTVFFCCIACRAKAFFATILLSPQGFCLWVSAFHAARSRFENSCYG